MQIDVEPTVQWARSRDNILMFSVPVSRIVGRMPVPRKWVSETSSINVNCFLTPLLFLRMRVELSSCNLSQGLQRRVRNDFSSIA